MQEGKAILQVEKWAGLTPYEVALERMEATLTDVIAGKPEKIFLCQHPPVYTVGTGGNPDAEVLGNQNIPVIPTGRGGKTTYHGPGQLVVYPVLNLATRGKDLRAYVKSLQNLTIALLAEYDIEGQTTDDIGVWVQTPMGLAKIAAIGVRVRKWVAFHGLAINVSPDMSHYSGIIPCGLAKPVTSLHQLGVTASIEEVETTLTRLCQQYLNPHP